ncbi:hypothetical protein [Pseudoalteromonas phage J2-1_QLiu-2017]|nr:hypothetical protein [Pseudoalteromonas phage J2-1_QLiu-2017]
MVGLPTQFVPYKVKEATGLVLWLLDLFGMVGWTSVWDVIYIKKEQIGNKTLIRHEQVHAWQIQRDGRVVQPIKYLYYTLKYGYRNNPYEIEARQIAKM